MKNFRETYLTNLTNIIGQIMAKDQLSQQDIEMLALFKSELKNYEYVSPFKRFLNDVDLLFDFIDKKLLKNVGTPNDVLIPNSSIEKPAVDEQHNDNFISDLVEEEDSVNGI